MVKRQYEIKEKQMAQQMGSSELKRNIEQQLEE